MTFELRYKYNDINLRIYSYDKDCKNGIYLSVVDDFLPEYRNIRITPEIINQYIELSRLELQEEIGVGEEFSKYINFVDYPQYGVSFVFDENWQKLQSIQFSNNYQFTNLKQSVSLEKAMELLGKGKMEDSFSEDSGPTYWVTYKYDNFNLVVVLHQEDGWGIEWYVENN